MCLRFACFGLHKHDDDDDYPPAHRSTGKTPRYQPPPQTAQRNGNGHAHYGNGGHRAAAVDEAGRKASNDVRKGPAAPAAAETWKHQPAWNNGAQYYYSYYEPAHKEEAAAMDYHHPTAAAAAADHER